MATLTWLGEDDQHGGGAGPSFTTAFGGIKFPKDKPVEVRSYDLVRRALTNQFFEVADPDDVDDAPEDAPPTKRKPGRPSKAEIAAREAEEKQKAATEKAEADRLAAAKLSPPKPPAPAYIPPPHEA